VIPEVSEAGVDDYAPHPCLEVSCTVVAVYFGENLKEGVAQYRFSIGLIIRIAQAYLQEISVIGPENMLLRFAVRRPATGYDIRQQYCFQTIDFNWCLLLGRNSNEILPGYLIYVATIGANGEWEVEYLGAFDVAFSAYLHAGVLVALYPGVVDHCVVTIAAIWVTEYSLAVIHWERIAGEVGNGEGVEGYGGAGCIADFEAHCGEYCCAHHTGAISWRVATAGSDAVAAARTGRASVIDRFVAGTKGSGYEHESNQEVFLHRLVFNGL
jgi:hypothetical protein